MGVHGSGLGTSKLMLQDEKAFLISQSEFIIHIHLSNSQGDGCLAGHALSYQIIRN